MSAGENILRPGEPSAGDTVELSTDVDADDLFAR